MASDIKSVQESGGGAPRPYVPRYTPDAPIGQPSPPTPAPPPLQQDVFQPPQVDTGSPNVMVGVGMPSGTIPPEPQKKSPLVLTLVIAGVIVLGALGYFVVYPLLRGSPEVVQTPPPAPAPAPAPEPQPEPTPTPTPPPVAPPAPVPITHVSLLKTAADATVEVPLVELSVAALQSGLTALTATSSAPTFTEVLIKREGNPMSFSTIMELTLPNVLGGTVLGLFPDDFTSFAYADAQGIWPGYAVQLKGGASLADAKAKFRSAFEGAVGGTLANLYVGGRSGAQTWKQGGTGDVANRYLIFTTPSPAVSLNYGWLGDTLVISTSYDAFKAALNRLR